MNSEFTQPGPDWDLWQASVVGPTHFVLSSPETIIDKEPDFENAEHQQQLLAGNKLFTCKFGCGLEIWRSVLPAPPFSVHIEFHYCSSYNKKVQNEENKNE